MADDRAEKLTDRYDREALAYRELWAPILETAAHAVIGALSGPPTQRVLDVGAGVGAWHQDLRAAFPGAFVLAVDRSRGMLSAAPPMPRAVMDARRLAVSSASQDVVILAFILFHLDGPLDALREARRVLRPEGRVGATTWATDLESKATRIWIECLDASGAIEADPDLAGRHQGFDAPEKMVGLLTQAGFRSPRAWFDELIAAYDVERLIRSKTLIGASRPRFESLDASRREACLAMARRRMSGLSHEDLLARGRVVHATAIA